RSKYAFVPSVTQRRVHTLATSFRHQGKRAPIFVEALINSIAVLFKRFPSVLNKGFTIEFGVRGLSILHFAPFNAINDKAVWIMSRGANMQNFSAAVTISTPSSPENIEDILEVLQSLATYGNECFSNVLGELVGQNGQIYQATVSSDGVAKFSSCRILDKFASGVIPNGARTRSK
ncbi:hypothetical protein PHMEG_0009265, partial [Phytophthora megakarya]